MKAAWYEKQGAPEEVLVVGEMPDPRPGADEVRIRLATSGVNPGEIKKRQGWLGSAMPYPRVIPHSDGAGTIDAVGEGVDPSRVGKRVWCFGAQSYRPFGTAAEFTTVPVWQAMHLPDAVSLEEGACLGIPGITAHRAVFADGPVRGKVVLVAGATGSVGAMATQLALWGGATVIATVRRPGDVDRARDLGARHVVDVSTGDAQERILELSPEGVDRIVESAFDANLAMNAAIVAQGAVIASYATAGPPRTLPYWPLSFQNVVLRLLGSDDFPRDAKVQAAHDLVSCLEAGALRIAIRETFPLERIAEAHDAVERPAGPGRIVVSVSGG